MSNIKKIDGIRVNLDDVRRITVVDINEEYPTDCYYIKFLYKDGTSENADVQYESIKKASDRADEILLKQNNKEIEI